MATIETAEEVEENAENQTMLYSTLEELLIFLENCQRTRVLPQSFKACDVEGIMKLGLRQERPQVNTYIMPVAASCLSTLFRFLSEGALETLEDHLLCANTAAALLSMFPSAQAEKIIDHCFIKVCDEAGCIVDFSEGKTEISLKLTVSKPLLFKLCMTNALLKNSFHLKPSVMVCMTQTITVVCYQYSSLTCLGFRTLQLWLSQWKNMGFCLDNIVSKNIYTIVVDNWENQISGVRKENVKVLNALLDVACPSTEFTLQRVLQHVMDNLSWKMKSKYFLLTTLIPKIGVIEVLRDHPCLVPALMATLGIPRLSSAGADVYRVCLLALPGVESWCEWFLQPILTLLSSEKEQDRLAQLNLLSRWLTSTLRQFPTLTENLKNRLAALEEENQSINIALSAVIHQGRKLGYITELWPAYSFIESHLIHSDEEVRRNAFSAVCKRTKKYVFPQPEEFEAVKKFLKQNVNSDCTVLRQSIMDSFSYFLERLILSSVKLISGEEKNIVLRVCTFLKWMHEFLLENLKLGGSYQRTVASLQLYLEILKWFGPWEVKKTSIGGTSCITSFAKDCNLWAFETQDSWHTVLQHVLDSNEDIQKVAAEILRNHLKLLGAEGAVQRMELLWKLALRQCQSPLFYDAESGRQLMQLFVQFFVQHPHMECVIPPPPDIVMKEGNVDIILIPFKELLYPQILHGNKHLMVFWQYEVERQWVHCQEDIFGAVTNGASLHGALAGFLPIIAIFDLGDVSYLLERLERIVDHFLRMISGQKDDNLTVSPSFAEMTEAINCLIPDGAGGDACTRLAPSHQLVLSCLWLTLKETCSLVAVLITHKHTKGLDAVRCLTIVEKILLRCRHKGTIEAAGAALVVMVRHVTKHMICGEPAQFFVEDKKILKDYLEDVLIRVLQGLRFNSNKTSVTRRSAGVGILVQKIVAADVRPNKPLLSLCLRKLCEIAEMPTTQKFSEPAASLGGSTKLTMPEESRPDDSHIPAESASNRKDEIPDHLTSVPEEHSPEQCHQHQTILHQSSDKDKLYTPLDGAVLDLSAIRLQDSVQERTNSVQARNSVSNLQCETAEQFLEEAAETLPTVLLEDSGLTCVSVSQKPDKFANNLLPPLLEGIVDGPPPTPPEACAPDGCEMSQPRDVCPKAAISQSPASPEENEMSLAPGLRDGRLPSTLPEGSVPERCKMFQPKNTPVLDKGSKSPPPTPLDSAPEGCDLPQASALHLLSRLAQDTSLRSEILPYSSMLALLCLKAFSSPLWTIRNAALQLYGILVPVIIGEKKVPDDDIESFGHLTLEEFLAHHPILTTFILKEMQRTSQNPERLECIVPILSLLSKLTFGDSWALNNCSVEIQDIRKYLKLLMKNSELMVRKLAAKCYSRLISKNSVVESIENLCAEMKGANGFSQNELYGSLVSIKYMILRLNEEGTNVETYRCIRQLLREVSLYEATWINRMITIEILQLTETHCEDEGVLDFKKLVNVVIHVLKNYSLVDEFPPGMYIWAVKCISFATAQCSEKEICSILIILLDNEWDSLSDICVQRIQARIPTLSSSTRTEIADVLLSNVHNKRSKSWDLLCSILTTILDLVTSVKITSSETIHSIFTSIEKRDSLHCWSVALPLCCELFAATIKNVQCISQYSKDFLRSLVVETHSRRSPDAYSANTRIYAARAFVVLFQLLQHLQFRNTDFENTDVASLMLDCGVALLQDQDKIVRKEASKSLVPEMHPYVCLLTFLGIDGLLSVSSPHKSACNLQCKLLDFSSYEAQMNQCDNADETSAVNVSPFNIGSSNVYAEEGHILQVMAGSYMSLVEDSPSWLKLLPVPPSFSRMEQLVSGLLHKWTGLQNDTTSFSSKVNILLLKLKILVQVADKVIPGIADYTVLIKLVDTKLYLGNSLSADRRGNSTSQEQEPIST